MKINKCCMKTIYTVSILLLYFALNKEIIDSTDAYCKAFSSHEDDLHTITNKIMLCGLYTQNMIYWRRTYILSFMIVYILCTFLCVKSIPKTIILFIIVFVLIYSMFMFYKNTHDRYIVKLLKNNLENIIVLIKKDNGSDV